MLKKTLGLVAFIVTLFAVLSASSACFSFYTNPKYRKSFLNDTLMRLLNAIFNNIFSF